MVLERKNTKEVDIGGVVIGGKNRVALQSMCNIKTSFKEEVLAQVKRLKEVKCDIARLSVFDNADALALGELVQKSPLPLVADIHFNANFAVKAMENGVAKIRINPGNFPVKKLNYIIDCAKLQGAAIRIGVNSGSVDKALMEEYKDKRQALLQSVVNYVDLFEKRGFEKIILSAKSTSVDDTVAINEALSQRFCYPLHIGLTEAGLIHQGIARNAIALYRLFSKGIGDTVRVSLTADPVEEVIAARAILKECGLVKEGVRFISCPKCGRCQIDLEAMAKAVYEHCLLIDEPLTVAVMGCEVNGPGECADADIGMAGQGNNKISFFKKGMIYKTVEKENAVELFLKEIDGLCNL